MQLIGQRHGEFLLRNGCLLNVIDLFLDGAHALLDKSHLLPHRHRLFRLLLDPDELASLLGYPLQVTCSHHLRLDETILTMGAHLFTALIRQCLLLLLPYLLLLQLVVLLHA